MLAPYRTVALSSAVPGTLGAVHVERSQLVEAGQVVAELAAEVERVDLDIARARVFMDAELRLTEAALVYDQRNARRLASLHASQAVAALERDRTEREAEVSRWQVQRAREAQEMRHLEVVRARTVLERKTIRSPITGFVVNRHRSAGEFVDEDPVVTIAQLHPLNVEAVVPLEMLPDLAAGMQAEVVVEGPVATRHRATVTVVDRVADAASGTVGVRLELPNPDYAVLAGLKCEVAFLPQGSRPAAVPPQGRPQEPVPMLAVRHDAVGMARALGGEAPAEVQACTAVGPLASEPRAERARVLLGPLSGPLALRREVEAHIAGFRVVDHEVLPVAAAMARLEQLQASGIGGLGLALRPGQRAAVAFGEFPSAAFAEQRMAELAAGASAVRTRLDSHPGTTWWLDLPVPASRHALQATLGESLMDVPLRCAPAADPGLLAERGAPS